MKIKIIKDALENEYSHEMQVNAFIEQYKGKLISVEHKVTSAAYHINGDCYVPEIITIIAYLKETLDNP